MGFLSALKNLLSPDVTTPEMDTEKEREALRRAWGLDPDDPVLAPERADQKASEQAELDPSGSSYDRHLWQNKMVRFATEAKEIAKIDFAGHVAELMAEHRNLGISDELANATAYSAFETAVRNVVADRKISLAEHAYLDALREALGLPNETATEIVKGVVADAESVFQAKIEGV